MPSDTTSKMNEILKAYDPEGFRKQGYQIVDIIAEYLNKAISKDIKQALPYSTPDEMLQKWPGDFSNEPTGKLENLIKNALLQSNHLHHPHYMGHQISPTLPAATLCDMTTALLNNSTAVFEMGPVSSVIEKSLINWMAKIAGFGPDAGGFLTSGGTLGNITALLTARQVKTGFDVWKEGLKEVPPLAVFVSDQAHYSIKRAGQIMGLGEDGVFLVPVDENYSMDTNALKSKYQEAINAGRKPFAIVASACSTATGSYDPIDEIADFCKEHDLW
ncbi:MAG TPA: pyridoxal-dependent decarboxylase, partial [Cyanobacteria bacterium UBA9579]|nr:pyridoxal-dependent decarboxylase [Cyanobacteria bacterium UBA9579]